MRISYCRHCPYQSIQCDRQLQQSFIFFSQAAVARKATKALRRVHGRYYMVGSSTNIFCKYLKNAFVCNGHKFIHLQRFFFSLFFWCDLVIFMLVIFVITILKTDFIFNKGRTSYTARISYLPFICSNNYCEKSVPTKWLAVEGKRAKWHSRYSVIRRNATQTSFRRMYWLIYFLKVEIISFQKIYGFPYLSKRGFWLH